ncbi:DNA polymerase III subunit epsilon [Neptunomonas sp.]|uniref:DNA polymerase III subunit epsilon n=1 Tax=Neptunomonas sp. TaxID=1971898 RepID=UPI00356671CB
MRQIILDTETTGLEWSEGHNIIEIGCVEMQRRRLTGNHYHQYVKPDREIDQEAMAVHGITHEFLEDKPRFKGIADEFLEFIRGAELIIHNATFDIGFIDAELERNGYAVRVADICTITDSLRLARSKHPGQKNNLNALCKRYGIDNSHRELHGALLDSEILADVYLALTGGQTSLLLSDHAETQEGDVAIVKRVGAESLGLPVLLATDAEIEAHELFLDRLDKSAGGECLWRKAVSDV